MDDFRAKINTLFWFDGNRTKRIKCVGLFRMFFCRVFLPVVFLSACTNSVPPAQSFYYWKTVFRLNETELRTLTELNVNRLYIRYFDVVSGDKMPLPDATIVFKDTLPANIGVIPVVFIVNRVLEELPDDEVPKLAERIWSRIERINHAHEIVDVPEIQMDCDWNVSTRDKYFCLLNAMRDRCRLASKQLSVTLRLHQMKYRKSTGIPSADKAVLMCYNMGRMTEYDTRNSVLDAEEVQKYMTGVELYPLPTDVALPLFDWGVCFGGRQYRGLINGLCEADMEQPYFSKIAPHLYRADSAVVLRGAYIRRGDQIRVENPSGEEIKQVARMLASRIKSPDRVIWYHLDSLLLQKYPHHELQEMGNLLR